MTVAAKLSAAVLAALCGAGPALAHHSFAMFDLAKVITVEATVKRFDWRMPHVFVVAVVPAAGGGTEEWAFECHSPNLVARKGWNNQTVKPGDKVTVLMHPIKDGSKMGSLINITLPSGQTLWNADGLNTP